VPLQCQLWCWRENIRGVRWFYLNFKGIYLEKKIDFGMKHMRQSTFLRYVEREATSIIENCIGSYRWIDDTLMESTWKIRASITEVEILALHKSSKLSHENCSYGLWVHLLRIKCVQTMLNYVMELLPSPHDVWSYYEFNLDTDQPAGRKPSWRTFAG